jgi:hypothetical protein
MNIASAPHTASFSIRLSHASRDACPFQKGHPEKELITWLNASHQFHRRDERSVRTQTNLFEFGDMRGSAVEDHGA